MFACDDPVSVPGLVTGREGLGYVGHEGAHRHAGGKVPALADGVSSRKVDAVTSRRPMKRESPVR